MADNASDRWTAGFQIGDKGLQGKPLSDRELVRADHADANGFLVEPGDMCADLLFTATGDNDAIAIDNVVVTNRIEQRIEILDGGGVAVKSTFSVPFVDGADWRLRSGRSGGATKQAIAVRRSAAVDDDKIDWSHAHTLRARAS